MKIDRLKVMQDGLRASVPLGEMVAFVKAGGIYTPELLQERVGKVQLIGITRFEDGALYIHDGHHRVASIWLSGARDYLYEREYFIKESTYARYMTPHFEMGWVTPFDPRIEVRVADFGDFKQVVIEMAAKSPNKAIAYIQRNRQLYVLPRLPRHDHIRGIAEEELITEGVV